MFTQEQKMIKIITKSLPAVISIEAYKDLKEIEKKNPQWIFPFSEKDISKVIALRDKIRGKHVHFGGGSGFIVDSSGIVVTNVHVIVRDHLNYEVTTSDGRKFPAVLATTDPIHDIAFLKIKSGTRFPTLALGDSSKTMLGQSVLAVGNALGLFRNTVSSGIISGLSRTIEANNESISENLHGLIQTDAAINPGNSGGPLINMAGEVIGINAASVMQAENIGFAIPINTIKKDLEQVKKYGKIIQPFLGVKYITIDPKIKDVLKLPVNYGALATGSIKEDEAIIKNSPAYKAGLKEGDIILEIDGNKLTPSFTIQEFLDSAKIGQRISIKILRKGKEMVLSAILEERR
jgi:serine protease Do